MSSSNGRHCRVYACSSSSTTRVDCTAFIGLARGLVALCHELLFHKLKLSWAYVPHESGIRCSCRD